MIDIEKFRGILAALAAELRTSLSGAADYSRPVAPDNAIGRLTRLEAMQSQHTAIEFHRRHEMRLRQVEEALERLEAGRYGECLKCGRYIPPARLEVKPETRVCVDCVGR